MCKYCEKYKHKDGTESIDLIIENTEEGILACIIPPSPVTKRKHEEDGLQATLQVGLTDTVTNLTELAYIPIKYCPICGKDLTK